jgi:hypothetical protein
MTYQLRRLRLHGLIERIPRTHREIHNFCQQEKLAA